MLFFSGLSPGGRRLLAALLLASPFLPFLLWPHPEIVTGALVTSSLAFRHDGRRVAAVLAMSLTSLQAAPLALAAALFWVEGSWAARRLGRNAGLRTVGRLTLALAPAFLPALFALVTFGHPSRSAMGCRKAWLQKRHLAVVTESCGGPPTEGPDFRELKARHGPDAWAYVSWQGLTHELTP